jgi:hypothetical protein
VNGSYVELVRDGIAARRPLQLLISVIQIGNAVTELLICTAGRVVNS